MSPEMPIPPISGKGATVLASMPGGYGAAFSVCECAAAEGSSIIGAGGAPVCWPITGTGAGAGTGVGTGVGTGAVTGGGARAARSFSRSLSSTDCALLYLKSTMLIPIYRGGYTYNFALDLVYSKMVLAQRLGDLELNSAVGSLKSA